MNTEFEQKWTEYVRLATELDSNTELVQDGKENIKFMRSLKFAPAFVSAASLHRGVSFTDLEIDWMMSWLQRQNRFFEIKKNMLPIGSDGRGNLIYVFDITDLNSPIIYYSHDPAVLIVIASNFGSFIESLIAHAGTEAVKSGTEELFQTFLEGSGLNDAVIKTWKLGKYNGDNDELGLTVFESDRDTIKVNLSDAKVKAGVSLAYFGKNTEAYYSDNPDLISIEKIDSNGGEKLDRKDRISTTLFSLYCVGSFIAFKALGFGIGQSLGLSIIAIIALATLLLIFDALFKRAGPRL